jgi:lysozyme
MKTSSACLDIIKQAEGYGKALPDGSCTAYQEKINGKLDIPTIGWGCTKGVTMGMVWTREQAETALRAELEKHEARVARFSTVDLNQNQFDALVSFDFNTGGLTLNDGKPSGVLKAVNASDWPKVAEELKRWDKFNGKPSAGLTARRAQEVALFLTPVDDVPTSYMPQQPEQAKQPMSRGTVATIWATMTGTATTIATNGIPAPPDKLTASAANLGAWKGLIADPMALICAAALAAIWGVSWLVRRGS